MHISSLKKISKIIGIIVLLVFALGATIFGGYKVAGNFAKASSCSAQKIATAQVSANSAVVSWESAEVTQGRVEYGTTATNLNFTAPEATSGKTHNVPLTLLTPNTVYYYLVVVGDNRCDSTGQKCDSGTCVPWSFTTSPIINETTVTILPPTPTDFPTPAPSATSSPTATSTAGISVFCKNVVGSLGQSKEATDWAKVKQYDIDGNGFINGLDVIRCQSSGK